MNDCLRLPRPWVKFGRAITMLTLRPSCLTAPSWPENASGATALQVQTYCESCKTTPRVIHSTPTAEAKLFTSSFPALQQRQNCGGSLPRVHQLLCSDPRSSL